jgi:predicted HTH transcriptional regulator
MSEGSTEDLVRRSESQVFERKRSLALQRKGLKSLCGMVNAATAEGMVVFGIASDGQVVGVDLGDLDEAKRSLAQTIASSFDPPLQYTISILELEGKRVVLVTASRNRDVPYHEFAGRVFIREGTVTRQLSLDERRSLQRDRDRDMHTGPWQCDRCSTRVVTLASIVVTNEDARNSYRCDCGGQFWPAT